MTYCWPPLNDWRAIVYEKTLLGPCYVYVLFNPLTNEPFYIGISQNPWYRFYQHCHDPCSAAWNYLGYLTENCGCHQDDILHIYKRCPDRQTALYIEHDLVTSTAGLLNKPYKRGRSYA